MFLKKRMKLKGTLHYYDFENEKNFYAFFRQKYVCVFYADFRGLTNIRKIPSGCWEISCRNVQPSSKRHN